MDTKKNSNQITLPLQKQCVDTPKDDVRNPMLLKKLSFNENDATVHVSFQKFEQKIELVENEGRIPGPHISAELSPN